MNNTRYKILFVLAIVFHVCIYTYGRNDTTKIYFRLDEPALSTGATHTLDSLVYYNTINSWSKILIVGYADHLGTEEYNDKLSLKRAGNVKDHLLGLGIPGNNITLCIGKGEVNREIELPEGYANDRRVDIVVISNETSSPTPRKDKVEKTPVQPVKETPGEEEEPVNFNSSMSIDPERLKVGQRIVLDRIFFYTGRHVVVETSLPELDRLFNILQENPSLEIRIEGHVCCVPPITDALDEDTHEIALSVNRAKFIYQYLIDKGVEPERLSYIGYGKTRPLRVHEFTQEDQDMNKRVEIRIIKK